MYIRCNSHLHLHFLRLDFQNMATSCAVLGDEMQMLTRYTKALPVLWCPETDYGPFPFLICLNRLLLAKFR